MSGSEKPIRAIRQLSLQPPARRRQQIRRQRSAEDDKSLQICASPFARGKRGTSGKPGSERPKVRVAWKENRQKNDEKLEQVEVVARQIPGRSKSTTRRSKDFDGIDKPTILYSRLELAERLRLAWKHREKNKANINIFLARETVDERCDSEMSNHTTTTVPSSPVGESNEAKIEIPLNDYKMLDEKEEKEEEKLIINKLTRLLSENDDTITSRKSDRESSLLSLQSSSETKQVLEESKVSINMKNKEREKERLNEETSRDSNIDDTNTKKKSSASIDCSHYRVASTTLPSIKIENSTLAVTKVSKEDFSSARQKRASFHSGTNRAFLDPIRSSTEFRWNSMSDKNVPQKSSIDDRTATEKDTSARAIVQSKENVTNKRGASEENPIELRCDLASEKSVTQRITANSKLIRVTEKNARVKATIESRDASVDDKTMTIQRTNEADRFNLIKKTPSTSTVTEDKDSSTIDKATFSRNSSEVRCSSVNERNPPSRKTMENQKIDRKSRRTSSAPPQRRFESTSANNRVQVNIVIDSSGKNKNQSKQDVECKDNAMEKIDMTLTKISSNRAVRSAPSKRRSRSAKRRFWGGSNSKHEEDGKSRNKSAGRVRNSIDSRTMDIVTMVSLVSSADSDSDTENSPRDDKLIDELRSKLPTTSIIKTSINSALSSTGKPIKSVSFQNSFDEDALPKEQQLSSREEKKTTQPRLAIVNQRGNGTTSSSEETMSWRTDVTGGLALPILALIHDVEEPLDVPLTDREKRCLAVPIGDLHDKKRKLLKTRSTPSRSGMERQTTSVKIKMHESPRLIPQKMEIPARQIKTSINNSTANVKSALAPPPKETLQHVQSMPIEPHFQTNKEKECWHLYKKMCDKGVCVSFDTVLRGMLTPTEYRLRQKKVSQNL
ncbi:uncharacterized protein LOC100642491 isoform X2 [Bombus terrestris]|uniref:Uncharacterized protein LOC100642491 isoform X2 n=1 Tax=Bombus terrestris TaxID=30195 RepID=A0A9B0C1P1_BOMTE|nr:uncharacterized protein LOC100642491 isoform X2 [Bombus terrestris]